ncbi:MAG: hypothetical protein HQ402_00065 [Parcubacteria group bacterium]|nr:hypothetical protein [Parcubacteria group bacterium]
MKNYITYIIVVFYVIFSVTSNVYAQTLDDLNIGGGAIDGTISVSLTPTNPQPNENVSIKLTSYSTNLDQAEISWSVDGVEQKKAFGEKEFGLVAPSVGDLVSVQANIQTIEGGSAQKTINIQPAGVDLLWQAESYSHPFYKGKVLWPIQGNVKVVAIPQFITSDKNIISSENLIYKWKKNGLVIGDMSGFGKNTLSLTGSIISRPLNISVEVTTLNNDMAAENRVTLSSGDTKLLLYEDNPRYGILYNKIIGSDFVLKNPEVSIVAEPYFFAGNTKDFISFVWSINGNKITDNKNVNMETFRQEDDTKGVAQILITASHTVKTFEGSQISTKLHFGENNSNTINPF